MKHALVFSLILLGSIVGACAQNKPTDNLAPAPLYRDPIYDGAADPVLIWNREEKAWWMLYTARRANVPSYDVSAYFGTKIGAASSHDNGKTWTFRGYLELEFEKGINTFWAPEIIYEKGMYHLYVTYIQGARNHWGGVAKIVHYTGKNIWELKMKNVVKLSSERTIDPTTYKKADGTFLMWYKDELKSDVTMQAESKDLENWTVKSEPAILNSSEGPKVFSFAGYYWMLTDEWKGLRVHRSTNLVKWEKQGLILDQPSAREDDRPSGAHGDVVVFNEVAYVIYFTHPGRESHLKLRPDADGSKFYTNHRTAIQVAPLKVVNGTLTSDRDNPFAFYLPSEKQ